MFAKGSPRDLNNLLDHVQTGMFSLTGTAVLPMFVASVAAHVGDGGRAKYLKQYENVLRNIQTAKPLK